MNIFQDYLREKFLESYSVFKMCKLTTLLCTSICAGDLLVVYHSINMHTNINIY